MKPENIRECFLTAAKRKTLRRDVAETIRPERPEGCTDPGPQCLQEHVDALQKILIAETYEPPKHRKQRINEHNCGKVREIVRPYYRYEQVVHHCIVRQIQPIVLHGIYEHALGSIPGRGPHDGKRTIEKWIRGYKGRKFYILKADVRHCFQTEDINVIDAKFRKIIKDDRFLRLNRKVLGCEAEMTPLSHLLEEMGKDTALHFVEAVSQSGPLLVGLPLGFVTSQWYTQLNYRGLDRKIVQEWDGADHYIRYMDDIVIFGRNKKKLHRLRQQIEEYLAVEMHQTLKRTWQVFRFEYVDRKTGKTRGRALDFMGFVFHHNRTTMRKSILERSRRKAHKINKKQRPTWYDASAMLSYMGWYDHTDTYKYYEKYIKPCINVRQLKKIVSKHSRKEQKRYDELVQSTEHDQTGRVRHHVQPDNGLPAQGDRRGADRRGSREQGNRDRLGVYGAAADAGRVQYVPG